jgi:hypothetical protein
MQYVAHHNVLLIMANLGCGRHFEQVVVSVLYSKPELRILLHGLMWVCESLQNPFDVRFGNDMDGRAQRRHCKHHQCHDQR